MLTTVKLNWTLLCTASIALLLTPAYAQVAAAPAAHYTPSSMTMTVSGHTLRIDALRPDVLRIRIFPEGHPAEDASWAVLPEARSATAPITAETGGLSTKLLRVQVAPDLRLTITDKAGNDVQQDATAPVFTGTSFQFNKSMGDSDHFFGLGDKTGPLDRRGGSYVMWNTDHFGWQDFTDPLYKSIPFFLNVRKKGLTVGVLMDNTYRSFFDFGHRDLDQYSFSASDGPVDYYVLYGPSAKQVVETYAWLTGPTPLPPLWTLGYQQSRYTYFPESQALDIAAHLRADHIPADALYLDIDYQLKKQPFTVDPVNYPDFAGFVKKLAEEKFHLVLITDLHIAAAAHQDYMPYDTGEAGDHFLKWHGKDFVGAVWPGDSVFPDFTQNAARAWWGTLYKQFADEGVAGFWNDMNEPAVFDGPRKTMPADTVHRVDDPSLGFAPRTATHLEIHNVYGMENARGTYEGNLALRPNVRPFVLTRASYAGGQRYSATWTGDNLATWSALAQTTPQLLNLGLSGFAFAGADYGFGGSPEPDTLTRWFELAAFQPIDRNHSAKGTRLHEPWVDGPEQEAIRRHYIEERYKLMPYLYTTAEEMSRTGLPIIRPMFLEFPQAAADGHPIDVDREAGGEFLFGPDILVAYSELPDEMEGYVVHFPPNLWYDYWTGTRIDRRQGAIVATDAEIRDMPANNKKPYKVSPELATLPVFVRAGAILPIAPLTQSTEEVPGGPLTLRVFPPAAPGDDCSGSVYTDDSKSFDYRKGVFARERFTCSVAADHSVTFVLGAREGTFQPWWQQLRVEVVGLKQPMHATVFGKDLAVEATSFGLAATLPDTGKSQTITFK